MKNIKIFFIAFFLSLPLFWGVKTLQENLEDFFYAQTSLPLQEPIFIKIPPKPKEPELKLQAESAMSVRINKAGREKTLFRRNTDKMLPIASLTKLMTAIIILENTPQDDYNFSKRIRVSKEAAGQENVPIYGNLNKGEVFSIEELLDLMLIYSSNDAAFTLSEIIDRESFIEKMNYKAQIIGLKNTRFVNSTGLDPNNQDQLPNYSTAEDLIEFSKYIIKNHPSIFEISLKQGPYLTVNGLSNLHLSNGQEFTGGKTGYTEKAGGCMLIISKDKKENCFINVVLGTDSSKERIYEMQKLIDWMAL